MLKMHRTILLLIVATLASCFISVLAQESPLPGSNEYRQPSINIAVKEEAEADIKRELYMNNRVPIRTRFNVQLTRGNKTLQEQGRLGVGLVINEDNCPRKHLDSPDYAYTADIPEAFDWRMDHSGCVPLILNQGTCGACWAFATAWALSARICQMSGGVIKDTLSPQNFLSCDKTCKIDIISKEGPYQTMCNNGCKGGWIDNAINYFNKTGVTTWEDMPYTKSKSADQRCNTVGPLFKGGSCYLMGGDTLLIKKDIIRNGPVIATFTAFNSFSFYESGVYSPKMDERAEGGHAVAIIGWGVEDGQSYWLAANSWGTDWGMNGFGKIHMHSERMNLGKYVAASLPNLEPGVWYDSFGFTSESSRLSIHKVIYLLTASWPLLFMLL